MRRIMRGALKWPQKLCGIMCGHTSLHFYYARHYAQRCRIMRNIMRSIMHNVVRALALPTEADCRSDGLSQRLGQGRHPSTPQDLLNTSTGRLWVRGPRAAGIGRTCCRTCLYLGQVLESRPHNVGKQACSRPCSNLHQDLPQDPTRSGAVSAPR